MKDGRATLPPILDEGDGVHYKPELENLLKWLLRLDPNERPSAAEVTSYQDYATDNLLQAMRNICTAFTQHDHFGSCMKETAHESMIESAQSVFHCFIVLCSRCSKIPG